MTFETEKRRVGREPFSYIEIDLDFCSLEYGVAPCAAVLGVTGAQPCFKTFPNCQDPDNYAAEVKTYRFCENIARLPKDLVAFPYLKAVTTTPAKLAIGSGIGERAKVSVTLLDAPHHDRGVDPYVSERAYNPMAQGTFWGKFVSRNRYYLGRPLRVVTGYITTDDRGAPAYDPDNFETRHYVIEKIDPPDLKGVVTITAKDILKVADDERAQAPRPAKGRLSAALDAVTTSANLVPSGIGNLSYAASGVLRINEELMDFTRSGDALTLVRGQYNSTAQAHDDDDAVQECYVTGDSSTGGEQLHDIIYDLLINYANVPAEWIDKPAWDAEAATYLTRLFQTIIATPVGVNQLLNELCEQGPAYLWTDELNKRINFRALRPASSASTTLDDDSHFLKGSLKAVDKGDERVSQVWMFFGQRKYTEPLDSPSNYKQLVIAVGDGEDSRKYGQAKVKKVFCRWINEFGRTFAEEISDSILQRYNETPKQITFALDPKDSDLLTGDLFVGLTRLAQGDDGDKRAITYQVIQVREKHAGENHRYEYEALEERYTPSATTGQRVIDVPESFNVNLRDVHDDLYAEPVGPVEVVFTIQQGVIVGSASTSLPALDVGEWPEGSDITLNLLGRVEGKGGDGGDGGDTLAGEAASHGKPGEDGGLAFLARFPITVDCSEGSPEIWGGGGGSGGGGAGANSGIAKGGGGGGGGAGSLPGVGGEGGEGEANIYDGEDGEVGTTEAGGAGGVGPQGGGDGAAGGGPGLAGAVGGTGNTGKPGGAAGDAGGAIDGVSYITFTGSSADIRGTQIN